MLLQWGATKIASANRPYMVGGSSAPNTASGSNMRCIGPTGALPFSVRQLSLSKLLRRSGLLQYSVPPWGACGLT